MTQKLSARGRRIACPHCGGMWGMNDDVRCVVDWSADMHRMYERWLDTPVVYQPWEGKKNQTPSSPNDADQRRAPNQPSA